MPTSVYLLLVCIAVWASMGANASSLPARRQVICNGTKKQIPSGGVDLYSVGIVNATVNFDTLLVASTTSGGGADFGEILNTINGIKEAIAAESTVASIGTLWNETWVALAQKVEADAEAYLASNDSISAESALHRASSYLQLAGRFSPLSDPDSLRIYNKSVQLFQQAMSLPSFSPRFAKCTTQRIPFQGSWMHAYWCPTAVTRPDGKWPTIITVNGYDGTAEIQYYTIARSMVDRGYNVLIFEGPGQGSTVRFQNLHFIPNFEIAVSAALNFVFDHFSVDPDLMFLWGESFGGYLAPRAFAHEPRFRGLVTNGGLYDFYQVLLCDIPESLQQLYYANESAMLNSIITSYAERSVALSFMINYGELGFGVSSYTELMDALSTYNLMDAMALFSNRTMFVYDPAWDTLTGNQSQIFYAHLPPSCDAELVQLDPYRGTGMHCAVGSTENINIAISRWLETKL